MSTSTFNRFHARLEKGGKAVQEWRYDDPKSVTMGYLLDSALWVPLAGVEPQVELLHRRSSNEAWFLFPQDARGLVGTSQGKYTIADWRTSGEARKRRGRDAVRLDPETRIVLDLGEFRLLIWMTRPPRSEKDHPLSRRLSGILREIPRAYVVAVFFSLLAHIGILGFIRSLPGLETLMPATVDDRVARITIGDVGRVDPDLQRRLQEAESMGIKIGGDKIRRPPNPVDAAGFIQAVVSPVQNAKSNSSFSNLFTASSFTKDLNQALSAKSFGDVLTAQAKAMANGPFGGGTAPSPGSGGAGTLFAAPALPSQGELPSAGSLGFQAGKAPAPSVAEPPIAAAPNAGTLDRNAVTRVFNAHSSELEDCFQRLPERSRTGSVKLTVVFDVAPDGKASSARIENASLADAGFHGCIASRVRAWTFPPPKGGPASFRYPLIFSASAKN